MVEKMALGELSGIPPLFPFQEKYITREELLKKEIYPPIPLWFRGNKGGDRMIWGKVLVEKLKELKVQEVLVRKFSSDEITVSEAMILWTGLEHPNEEWNSYRMKDFDLLPTPLQQLVAEMKLDLKTALRVRNLPLEIIEILNPFLETLSYSQRRIFLRLFFEVFQRDLLDTREGIALAIQLVHSSKPLEELYQIRYPELHRLEQTYHATVDPVLKGTGIQVSPPPYFEGARFKVEFYFGKSDQLKKKAQILQKLSETIDPVIEQLTHDTV